MYTQQYMEFATQLIINLLTNGHNVYDKWCVI